MYYHEKKILIPIYYVPLYMIITDDIPIAVKKHRLKFDLDISNSQALTVDNVNINGVIYIIFPNKGLGFLVHECKHAVNMIFKNRCVELDINNDEFECYLVQYIFEQCYNFLKSNL